MSKSIYVLVGMFFALATLKLQAQTNDFATNNGEFSISGPLAGDQVKPDVAMSANGGYVVWQDNVVDGQGLGIEARRLDQGMATPYSPFPVNVTAAGDQENARVAMLKNGGAVFVWQGGVPSYQHIYARFVSPTNTFLSTNDLLVTSSTNYFQQNPVVAVLTNSDVVIVWASYDQASPDSMQDVYGQVFSQDGQKIGGTFLVNQTTAYNQRTPAVAALADGGFVVGWVSEQQRTVAATNTTTAGQLNQPSVDIYARIYNDQAVPTTSEFLVNADNNVCADPRIAAASDGSFMVAWSGKSLSNTTNGWDIYARPVSSSGQGGNELLVNTYQYGDQYGPVIRALNLNYLIAWRSLGQGGYRSGIYGQFVNASGSFIGGEFRVNATPTGSPQQPAVASDGTKRFLVAWSSFTADSDSYDIMGQSYIEGGAVLYPLSVYVWRPFYVTNNAYQPELLVTWPKPQVSVSSYQVYVDGSSAATVQVTTNQWMMTSAFGLTPNSTHSFKVGYTTVDGRQAPLSASASGTTYSSCNYMNSGIPCDWIAEMYTTNPWPTDVNAPLVPGGPTLLQVFLSGGNPTKSNTWLHTTLSRTSTGVMKLTWPAAEGATYQVQSSTNLTDWSDYQAPYFSNGTVGSEDVTPGPNTYFRVVLLR